MGGMGGMGMGGMGMGGMGMGGMGMMNPMMMVSGICLRVQNIQFPACWWSPGSETREEGRRGTMLS